MVNQSAEYFNPDLPETKVSEQKEQPKKKEQPKTTENNSKGEISLVNLENKKDNLDNLKGGLSSALSGAPSKISEATSYLGFTEQFLNQLLNTKNTLGNVLANLFKDTITDVNDPLFYEKQRSQVESDTYKETRGSRADIYNIAPQYMDYQSMPPQLQAAIGQVSLGFLSDLVGSLAPSRAPMSSTSAKILEGASTSLRAREENNISLNQRIREKNIEMFDANIKRKLEILKEMSADERDVMKTAVNKTKDMMAFADNLFGKVQNVYNTEAREYGVAQKTRADIRKANLKAEVDALNTTVAATRASIEIEKLGNDLEKEKLAFLGFNNPGKTNELIGSHVRLGGNASDVVSTFQLLKKNIKHLNNPGVNATAGIITSNVNKLTDKAYRDAFDSYKNNENLTPEQNNIIRKNNAVAAKAKVINSLVSYYSSGIAIDPETFLNLTELDYINVNNDTLTVSGNKIVREILDKGLPQRTGASVDKAFTQEEALLNYSLLQTYLRENQDLPIEEKNEIIRIADSIYKPAAVEQAVASLTAFNLINSNTTNYNDISPEVRAMEGKDREREAELKATKELKEVDQKNKIEYSKLTQEQQIQLKKVEQKYNVEKLNLTQDQKKELAAIEYKYNSQENKDERAFKVLLKNLENVYETASQDEKTKSQENLLRLESELSLNAKKELKVIEQEHKKENLILTQEQKKELAAREAKVKVHLKNLDNFHKEVSQDKEQKNKIEYSKLTQEQKKELKEIEAEVKVSLENLRNFNKERIQDKENKFKEKLLRVGNELGLNTKIVIKEMEQEFEMKKLSQEQQNDLIKNTLTEKIIETKHKNDLEKIKINQNFKTKTQQINQRFKEKIINEREVYDSFKEAERQAEKEIERENLSKEKERDTILKVKLKGLEIAKSLYQTALRENRDKNDAEKRYNAAVKSLKQYVESNYGKEFSFKELE